MLTETEQETCQTLKALFETIGEEFKAHHNKTIITTVLQMSMAM